MFLPKVVEKGEDHGTPHQASDSLVITALPLLHHLPSPLYIQVKIPLRETAKGSCNFISFQERQREGLGPNYWQDFCLMMVYLMFFCSYQAPVSNSKAKEKDPLHILLQLFRVSCYPKLSFAVLIFYAILKISSSHNYPFQLYEYVLQRATQITPIHASV